MGINRSNEPSTAMTGRHSTAVYIERDVFHLTLGMGVISVTYRPLPFQSKLKSQRPQGDIFKELKQISSPS